MSLINEALKKAQKERALQAGKSRKSLLQESDSPGSSQAGAARANTSLPLVKLLFGLVIAGSTLASAVAFMIFLFIQVQEKPAAPAPRNTDLSQASPSVILNPGISNPANTREVPKPQPDPVGLSNQTLSQNLEEAPTLTANRLPTEEPTSPPPESNPAPEPTLPTPEPSTPEFNVPTPDPEPEDNGNVTSDLDPGLVGSSKNPYPSLPNPPETQSLSPRNQERVEEYIRNASVTGTRLSGPDSKVVLNNKVYRIQELVLDFDLYLKVVGIQKRQIIFEDEYGFRYTKRF